MRHAQEHLRLHDNVKSYWELVRDNNSSIDTRGAALLMPGLNMDNKNMDSLSEILRSERFDVHRVLLTQDPTFIKEMNPNTVREVVQKAREETARHAAETGGKECVMVGHSFACLSNTNATLHEGGTPFEKELELAPPYHIGEWHRLASVMGRLPLPKALTKHIPISSWNPHEPDEDPLEHSRVHTNIPVSAYQTLFEMYVNVRNKGIGKAAEKFVAIDTKDELVDAEEIEKFLEQERRKGLTFLLHKIMRKSIRGKRYHHSIIENEPHIPDGSAWWKTLSKGFRSFINKPKIQTV